MNSLRFSINDTKNTLSEDLHWLYKLKIRVLNKMMQKSRNFYDKCLSFQKMSTILRQTVETQGY